MKLRRLWRWLQAAVVAARTIKDGPTLFQRARGLLGFLWRRTVLREPPREGWQKLYRLGCGRCSIFDRKRRTCGTPGKQWENPWTEEFEQQGCLCICAAKCMDAHSICWLAEATNGEQDGWRDL